MCGGDFSADRFGDVWISDELGLERAVGLWDDHGYGMDGDLHGADGDGIDAVCGECDGDERVWDVGCGDIYVYDQSEAGDADDQRESAVAVVFG